LAVFFPFQLFSSAGNDYTAIFADGNSRAYALLIGAYSSHQESGSESKKTSECHVRSSYNSAQKKEAMAASSESQALPILDGSDVIAFFKAQGLTYEGEEAEVSGDNKRMRTVSGVARNAFALQKEKQGMSNETLEGTFFGLHRAVDDLKRINGEGSRSELFEKNKVAFAELARFVFDD